MRRYKTWVGGLLALLIVSVNFAKANDSRIEWRRDMKQAYKEAQVAGKPMFVQFTAEWCGYCKKMEQSTFQDPQVVEFINRSFVPLLVDKDQNEKFARAVGIQGLPSTIIISSDLEVRERLKGYQSSWELTKALSGYQRLTSKQVQLAESQAEPRTADPLVTTAVGLSKPEPTSEAAAREIAPSADDAATQEGQPLVEEPADPFAETDGEENPFSEPKPSLPPLAFDGRCLVSALDDRQLVEGSPDYGVVYGKRMVFFASTAHREAFIANPKAYWPANDGYCPVATQDSSQNRPGRLEFATVYRNRLWLFADDEARSRFMGNPRRYSQE